MFLRRCDRRKDGKVHSYWALVESHRTAKGSRQRVVAYLGELKPSERTGWAELGGAWIANNDLSHPFSIRQSWRNLRMTSRCW